jgi:uncharacterized protein (DUF927 family)
MSSFGSQIVQSSLNIAYTKKRISKFLNIEVEIFYRLFFTKQNHILHNCTYFLFPNSTKVHNKNNKIMFATTASFIYNI